MFNPGDLVLVKAFTWGNIIHDPETTDHQSVGQIGVVVSHYNPCIVRVEFNKYTQWGYRPDQLELVYAA